MTETANTPKPAAIPSYENVPLDEVVWKAWVDKGRARDRMRSARRAKIIKYLFGPLVIAAIIWSTMQG
jgi:hypothetical protein